MDQVQVVKNLVNAGERSLNDRGDSLTAIAYFLNALVVLAIEAYEDHLLDQHNEETLRLWRPS